ncbi:MAG: glycosyltransferase [Alphaproteobacteria bacterium]
MPPLLSYALMTHNEFTELQWLMEVIRPFQNDQTEIVVLDDFSEPPMVDYIKSQNVRFYQRALNKNFSAQRNYLKNLCKGEFIFLLDPDELPSPQLLADLPKVLAKMRDNSMDACCMSRLNILVDGDSPVDARTLTVSDADLVHQKRDDQIRILQNVPGIYWVNHVHERMVGLRRACRLPQQIRYALLHCKTRARQGKQNAFYRGILLRYVDKWRKSLSKRLGLIKHPQWMDVPESWLS